MKKDSKSEASKLREKAEALLALNHHNLNKGLSVAEAQKLNHELEVHQVELGLQNEELIQAIVLAKAAMAKYTELYDFAPAGYFTLSSKGEILELNLTGAKMLGKDRSQLTNRLFALYLAKTSKPAFNQFLKSIFESSTKQTCEISICESNQAEVYLQLEGIVSENDRCYIAATDITARKLAENQLLSSNKLYETLLQTIPFGMDIVDEYGNILYVNEKLTQTLGKDVTGKKCWETYRDNKMQCADCPLHAGIQVGETNRRTSYNLLGGKIFEVTYTGMEYNGQKAMLEIFTDITQRKQAEAELEMAKQRAEESDRLKTAFLANISHEIRTPMNGILGFTELLKKPDLTGNEQMDYIHIIQKSGNRMLNTLNEIVDISKIESGQMLVSPSKVHINEQMDFIASFFAPEAKAKGIKLTYTKGLMMKESAIETDLEKFIAILTNLVKNAIKYTDSGSINFGYALKPAGPSVQRKELTHELEFYVKDSGIGIPPARQQAIFERFIQADVSDHRAVQGAGLGLSIAKAYTEMLGGRIWVESTEGQGSTFYFTLPYTGITFEQKAAAEFMKAEKTAKPTRKLKILIAEDDETSEMFLSVVFGNLNHTLLKVWTGNTAVDVCRKNPDIDLVMMDIKMPGIDGYEATRQIRTFNKNVVVIAQTAFGLVGEREKALQAGCNDYISKPIVIDLLLNMLEKHFNG